MKKIVVGGIPNPIGGVTSFVSRLAENNYVDVIFDLYPSKSKKIPSSYSGTFHQLKGVLSLVVYYFFKHFTNEAESFHFNFSRVYSILFFLILPKGNNNFQLMLHHGLLHSNIPFFLQKYILKKFDLVYALNDQQYNFYLQRNVDKSRIEKVNSYVKPSSHVSGFSNKELEGLFVETAVLICSGYPTHIYNHRWCIDFVEKRLGYKLAIFLYGEGEDLLEIKALASDKVKVFYNMSQSDFNYAISCATAYLRPTSTDSFGIAVADAVEFSTPVFASNVCERYPGVGIFTYIDYDSFSNDLDVFLTGFWKNYSTSLAYKSFSDREGS